jgi:hypothetical protein
MNKSLFQISTEARELASALIEGELSPEMESALVINQNELQEKAINYGFVIKSIESDISIIDSEIERLQTLKTSRTNAIKRMKATVLEAMNIYGIKKVNSPTLNLSVRLNPRSVDLVNEYQIPDCYKKEKVTISIDKVMIKEDLRSGLEVPGAVLKRTQKLEIK